MSKEQTEIIANFYRQNIIDPLRDSVTEAEEHRKRMEHDQVHQIVDSIANIPTASRTLKNMRGAIKEGINIKPELDWYRVGLAGAIRIDHVTTNTELKISQTQLFQILNRVSMVEKLYELIQVGTLPPVTIHGDSICWLAETTQDMVTTYVRTGQNDRAINLLDRVIPEIFKQKETARDNIDLLTPDDLLKADNYSAWQQRKVYLGSLSGLGVLYIRRGQISHDIQDMNRGLWSITQAHEYEPNPHRLATVSLWGIMAAFQYQFKGSLADRWQTFQFGQAELRHAYRENPTDVKLAAKQYLKQSLPILSFIPGLSLVRV